MKTVAIFSGFALPHTGGIESYTDRLAKQFDKIGIKTIVVASNFDDSKTHWKESGHIHHYRLPTFRLAKNRFPIIKKNREYREIIKRLERDKIDAIIVNTRFHLTSHIGAKFGKKHGIPAYLVEHGSAPLTVGDRIADLIVRAVETILTRRIQSKITRFYAVSRSASDHLWRRYRIRSSGEWYNQVDTGNVLPRRDGGDKVRIAYVGRVLKQKGIEVLLQAVAELNQDVKKKVQIDIVGDGPDLAELQQRYAGANVNFRGRLPHAKVQTMYPEIDIVAVVANHPEGLNGVVLEAGLAGCAVIATPVPGINEIIVNSRNGLTVEVSDVSDLSKKLTKLVNDKRLRIELGGQLQKDVVNQFSVEKVARKILKDIGMLQ